LLILPAGDDILSPTGCGGFVGRHWFPSGSSAYFLWVVLILNSLITLAIARFR